MNERGSPSAVHESPRLLPGHCISIDYLASFRDIVASPECKAMRHCIAAYPQRSALTHTPIGVSFDR